MTRIRTRIRFPKRAAVLLACLLAGWPAGRAGAQPSVLELYAHRAWPLGEVTPGESISGIAQTGDGYLWMSTWGGLVRFDGVRATPWKPSAGPSLPEDFWRIRGARDGSLWIGGESGLAVLRNERLSFIRQLAGQHVINLYDDPDGTMWVAIMEPGRLCSVRGPAVACHDDGRFGAYVRQVLRDRAGTLWVLSERGLWRWAPGPPRLYPVAMTPYAAYMVEDETGAILLSTHLGFLRMENGEFRPYRLPGIRGRVYGQSMHRDREGGVWIRADGRGVFYLRDGRTYHMTTADGLSGIDVDFMFEDREGNMWFATESGLDKLNPVTASRVGIRQGLSSHTVWAVQADPDGSVWLATPAGLNRWRDGQVTVYAQPDGAGRLDVPAGLARVREPRPGDPVQSPIYALGFDRGRRLWAATPNGLVRAGGDGFVPVPGTLAAVATAIQGDTAGAVWTTYLGVATTRWTPDGRVRQFHPAKPTGENSLTSMVADPRRGGIWSALFGVGVVYMENARILETYTAAHGITRGHVTDLRMTPDGAVWATHGVGVTRIADGRATTLGVRNGLPCEATLWSIEDGDGAIWMRTACGLVRVPRADLQAWLRDPTRRVDARIFGRHELPPDQAGVVIYRPFATRAADGRIWFADARGAGVIDPRRVRFDETPPPVHVERVIADGRTYPVVAGRALRVPPRPRALEIQFTALDLTMPDKVPFRFMLEGQDRAWREAVNQRQIEYSNLAPGTYRFRVMAANHDGVWNTAGASLTLVVAPAWNQTWWFFALVAAALAALPALTAVAWQRRRARRAAERERARFEAMLAERTRVARELHDTLLGDMAGVAMQLSAGARRAETSAGADAPVVELLTGLGTQVQRTLVEARASVTALRTAPETLPPLHERLADAARRAFEGTGTAARVEHTGSPPSLAPTVEAEILGIATEAMTNARKHADARTVTVTSGYGARGLRIGVRDDGRGFDPSSAAPAGHWGLIGMRERAAAIGALLDVTSAPGKGTEVALVLPVGDGRRRGWTRMLGRGRGRPAVHRHDPESGGDAT